MDPAGWEVEEFSLEPYELYVGKSDTKDVLDKNIAIDVTLEDDRAGELIAAAKAGSAESEMLLYKLGSFKVVALDDLPHETVPMRASIKLAVRRKDGSRRGPLEKAEEYCAAIAGLTLQSGLCDRRKGDSYRPDLVRMFETLYPRNIGAPKDFQESCMRLNAKVMYNAFGGVGGWTTSLLHSGSYFNHSCLPNTYAAPAADNAIEFRLYCPLAARSELTISYLPFPVDSQENRAQMLSHRFKCTCKACAPGASIRPSIYWLGLSRLQALKPPVHCWYCGNDPAGLMCPSCKLAHYCSERCQRANWPVHRHFGCGKSKQT